MSDKKPWNLDAAVLLIFFARDRTFSKVFESVRNARPRILLLWQDGPREGREDDMGGILRCRKIAENIDWDCEVHISYHEKNFGCDPSTFFAQKWAFSIVDKCIILEDDQVAGADFYLFCKELLDKYENDERISHINGHNFLPDAETWCPYDYLFARTGTGAWASWKRVADTWDSEYTFLDKSYDLKNLVYQDGKRSKEWIKTAKRHKKTGVPHWESVLGMAAALGSRYAIIPRVNLVQNIGVTEGATHSIGDDIRIYPKAIRGLFECSAKELTFPLKHPTAVVLDEKYEKELDRIRHPSRVVQFLRKCEMLFNCIRYGHADMLVKLLSKKIKHFSKE
jgi:hypothetical protein